MSENQNIVVSSLSISIGERYLTQEGHPRYKADLHIGGEAVALVFSPRTKGVNDGPYIATIPSATVAKYGTATNKTLTYATISAGGRVDVDLTPKAKNGEPRSPRATRKQASTGSASYLLKNDLGQLVLQQIVGGIAKTREFTDADDVALLETYLMVADAHKYYSKHASAFKVDRLDGELANIEKAKKYMTADGYKQAIADAHAEYGLPSIREAAKLWATERATAEAKAKAEAEEAAKAEAKAKAEAEAKAKAEAKAQAKAKKK